MQEPVGVAPQRPDVGVKGGSDALEGRRVLETKDHLQGLVATQPVLASRPNMRKTSFQDDGPDNLLQAHDPSLQTRPRPGATWVRCESLYRSLVSRDNPVAAEYIGCAEKTDFSCVDVVNAGELREKFDVVRVRRRPAEELADAVGGSLTELLLQLFDRLSVCPENVLGGWKDERATTDVG